MVDPEQFIKHSSTFTDAIRKSITSYMIQFNLQWFTIAFYFYRLQLVLFRAMLLALAQIDINCMCNLVKERLCIYMNLCAKEVNIIRNYYHLAHGKYITIRDFPDHAILREKSVKALTLCNKANFDPL